MKKEIVLVLCAALVVTGMRGLAEDKVAPVANPAPGPNGAIGTVRFEMIREGVQECEARIFIEEVLLDKAQRAKLGAEKAKEIQEMLDERIRAGLWGAENYGWYVSSGWQERSGKLYAAAAEVAKALGDK